MLELEKYINAYIEEKKYSIKFDEFKVSENKKHIAVLSTDDHMLSIGILNDLKCNITISRTEDEKLFYIATIRCENMEELKCDIKMLIERLNYIQEKHSKKVDWLQAK